jgi:hypothetical protein
MLHEITMFVPPLHLKFLHPSLDFVEFVEASLIHLLTESLVALYGRLKRARAFPPAYHQHVLVILLSSVFFSVVLAALVVIFVLIVLILEVQRHHAIFVLRHRLGFLILYQVIKFVDSLLNYVVL